MIFVYAVCVGKVHSWLDFVLLIKSSTWDFSFILLIHWCRKLKSLPNFLHTTPLQKLQINYCPILKEHYEKGTGKEWPKISHIPNIWIDRIYVQRDVREYEAGPKGFWRLSD